MIKKYLLSLVGCLALSTASSSAALLLKFTEERGNVVMRVTGSVDVTRASFFLNEITSYGGSFSAHDNTVLAVGQDSSGFVERVSGVSLLRERLISDNHRGISTGGEGNFIVHGGLFFAFSDTDMGVLNNNAKSATVTASTREVTFLGKTFSSMGLDAHAPDTTIDLWGAATLATNDEKIQFVVASSVPEPSSSALLGLGVLGGILRRRR